MGERKHAVEGGEAALFAPAPAGGQPFRVQAVELERPGDELVVSEGFAHRGDPPVADEVVGVAEGEGTPAAGRGAGVAAGVQARAGPGVNQAYPAVGGPVAVNDVGGAVGGPVVRHDDLPRPRPLLGQQGVQLSRERALFVAGGDDDGELAGGRAGGRVGHGRLHSRYVGQPW